VEELERRDLLTGTWMPLINGAPSSIGTMFLLSDGTVMAQEGGSQNWDQLKPDSSGNYMNGTWSALAPMSMERLYYGSNVLPDGRVFILGGEYSGPGLPKNFTNTGEIYNPASNSWTSITPFPQSMYGDDPSEVLPDGRVLVGYLAGPQTYIYDPATNTFTQTGTKLRGDPSDEEAWVKLPDNSILSYDIFSSNNPVVLPGHAQRYIPSTGQWVDAGSVPVSLSSNAVGFELGPAFLLPNGLVLQLGGNSNTALYNPATNTWTAGPTIPGGKGADDAPGAILPNGDLLFVADTPLFTAPAQIFDYNFRTNTITQVPLPPGLATQLTGQPSFPSRMVVLPSGQLLLAPNSFTANQLWVYTPDGGPQDAWRPTITNVVNNGNGTFTLTGTQLTGISEGSNYGDDVENATNYPIVQISDSAGHLLYARTSNWSSTGVAQGSTPQSTPFTLPSGLAPGPLSVVVIANGIPSLPFVIPAAAPAFAYYPFRYVFNRRTHLYSGLLTITNTSTDNLTGQFLIGLMGLGPGVTVADPTANFGGLPFMVVNGTLGPGSVVRIPIHLRNPHHVPMSTFYIGFPVLFVVNTVNGVSSTVPLGTLATLTSFFAPRHHGPLLAPGIVWSRLEQSLAQLSFLTLPS
jgi:hypothetical protein